MHLNWLYEKEESCFPSRRLPNSMKSRRRGPGLGRSRAFPRGGSLEASRDFGRRQDSNRRLHAQEDEKWQGNHPHHQRAPGDPQGAQSLCRIASSTSPTFPNPPTPNSAAPAGSAAPPRETRSNSSPSASPRNCSASSGAWPPSKPSPTKRSSTNCSKNAPGKSPSAPHPLSFPLSRAGGTLLRNLPTFKRSNVLQLSPFLATHPTPGGCVIREK